MQEQDLKKQDALIANNSQTGESGVVTGMKPDGTPQMEDPAKAAKFLTFDRHADILDNFLRNFTAQCKNPTIFGFFKVPADQVPTMGFAVNQMVQNPDMPGAKDMLTEAKVKMPDGAPKQKQEETVSETVNPAPDNAQTQEPQRFKQIDESKINWDNLAAWGITKESIGEQNLRNMVNNRMSDLVKVTPTFGNEKYELEARLSLHENPDGSIKVVPHFIRQEPNLNDEFHGVKFTKEDKEMLKATGNLGRVIDLKDAKGNTIPSYVSIDRKTNELIALPVSALYIRNKIGETELTPKEIGLLKSGTAPQGGNAQRRQDFPGSPSGECRRAESGVRSRPCPPRSAEVSVPGPEAGGTRRKEYQQLGSERRQHQASRQMEGGRVLRPAESGLCRRKDHQGRWRPGCQRCAKHHLHPLQSRQTASLHIQLRPRQCQGHHAGGGEQDAGRSQLARQDQRGNQGVEGTSRTGADPAQTGTEKEVRAEALIS